MSATVSISTLDGDGSFSAYCARPEGEPRAAIVVIQEIFGVNAGIRRKCDRLAADGYLALAPDLFWRLEPGVELDPDVEAEFQRALGLHGHVRPGPGRGAISRRRSAMRATRSASRKVGVVGYCLGGRLAYMVAARTDADASVGYYAVGIPDLLREKHAIAHPLMLHLAGADHFVPPEAQAAIHAGLDDHPKVTLHDYPGVDHGFATEIGARRSEAGGRSWPTAAPRRSSPSIWARAQADAPVPTARPPARLDAAPGAGPTDPARRSGDRDARRWRPQRRRRSPTSPTLAGQRAMSAR